MSGHSEPKPVKQLAGQVRKELIQRQLLAPVKIETARIDKVDHWKVVARAVGVKLDSGFPGHWRLNLSWTFTPVPAARDPEILESSVGLYGVGVPALGGVDDECCLVRYDVDNKRAGHSLGPLGPHLNVMQPGKLQDHVHYPLPGIAKIPWTLSDILDVLLSGRLVEDLRGRLNK
jgi:hypothetical protein